MHHLDAVNPKAPTYDPTKSKILQALSPKPYEPEKPDKPLSPKALRKGPMRGYGAYFPKSSK